LSFVSIILQQVRCRYSDILFSNFSQQTENKL